MCYNVLCDKYATRQLYGYCPSWALNWEYRKKGIMEEITSCDADIISLQVKLDHLVRYFKSSSLTVLRHITSICGGAIVYLTQRDFFNNLDIFPLRWLSGYISIGVVYVYIQTQCCGLR